MAIRVIRLGTARTPDEGLRISTVRRPSGGVARSEFAPRNRYDIWFPNLSPSPWCRGIKFRTGEHSSEMRPDETESTSESEPSRSVLTAEFGQRAAIPQCFLIRPKAVA